MLINASRLIGTKVLSLQLGGAVAQVVDLIINPDNLQIIAFQLEGPVIGGETGDILDARSIREFSQLGFIIDDTDELVFRTDVVRIDQIMSLGFHLVGLKVVTQKGASLGKISDFVVDPSTLLTQQLVVQRPFFKSLMDPELIIHRSQIVEVDDYKVTVKEDTEKDLYNILMDAIPGFECPRFPLWSFTEVEKTDEETGVVITIPAFSAHLTTEEINILAILMYNTWL